MLRPSRVSKPSFWFSSAFALLAVGCAGDDGGGATTFGTSDASGDAGEAGDATATADGDDDGGDDGETGDTGDTNDTADDDDDDSADTTSGDGDGDDDGGDIDWENNLLASPMPPGDLDPENAPQIVVFGWDDCIFTGDHASDTSLHPDSGMNFIASAFGDITNPDGSPGHVSFYENGAYLPNSEVGGPWGSETDLTVAAGQELLALGFELGNHTFDHLEINGTWGQIPAAWNTGSLGGWADGAGTLMDQATWLDPVITFNDTFLVNSYGIERLYGFRAPRLEINDNGLQAVKEAGYLYDVNMEEGLQWEYITAATTPGADAAGFDWVVWPHTLDNGSPGVWQTQDFGEKAYLQDFPTGLWEAPVYMLYIPDNGLQETIADRMKAEITDEPTDWIGDRVREVTAFDFNTFLFARMTREEWVEVMKYNFLLRYNGNRAPLTFGAHPAEFSWRYDNEVVLMQPGNEDFHDVLNYNTFQDRKEAVYEFIDWVKANYGDDVYFMSNLELVEYMKEPFDKTGAPVSADTLATPEVNDLLDQLGDWNVAADELGSDAEVNVVDGNTMTIDFTVGTSNEAAGEYAWVDVASYFEAGMLSGVSHIDVVYETDAPVRLRLVQDESTGPSLQVLLAGVGGERAARIRMKDFRPDPYMSADVISSTTWVGDAYLADVVGLAFQSASTEDQTSFTLNVKRIVVHGLDVAKVVPKDPTSVRWERSRPESRRGEGSAAHWPHHREG